MTELETRHLLETLFFPPGIIILAILLILSTATIKPHFFTRLLFLSGFFLWLFSIPAFSYWITDQLQNKYPSIDEVPAQADVIIVLGAEQIEGNNEYGSRTMLGKYALERARYAGYLAKKTGLPVIASGGKPVDQSISQAELMKRFLMDELSVKRVIAETRSATTYQNALFSSALLREHGFKHPVLVTHAWHMPRSVGAFKALNVKVLPAPTARVTPDHEERGYFAWLPTASGLLQTRAILHEVVGRIYYYFKYYSKDKSQVVLDAETIP